MNSFYKSILNNLLILLAIALLAQCTGLDSSPGGAPGGLQAGLGALDGPGSVGSGLNPAAPVSQPTEDGILRIRPQIILALVLPPPKSHLPNTTAPSQQVMASAEYSGSHDANFPIDEIDPEVEDGEEEPENKWNTQVEIGDQPQQAQEVPGEFIDSQPYVWALQVGKTGPVTPYEATNDYGLANLRLYYVTPKDQVCDTQFNFYACDKVTEKVWVARPVHAICPEGTYSDPYVVHLQLVRAIDSSDLGSRDCPPPKTHALEEAPAVEAEARIIAPAP